MTVKETDEDIMQQVMQQRAVGHTGVYSQGHIYIRTEPAVRVGLYV